MDLRPSIAGRTFINSDGKRNMPSGEIFTGPVEESAEGWVRFTYPAIQGGGEVEGVEMVFAQGKWVVKANGAQERSLPAQPDRERPAAPPTRASSPSVPTTASSASPRASCTTKDWRHHAMALGSAILRRQPQRVQHSLGFHPRHAHRQRDSVDGELLFKDGQFIIGRNSTATTHF